MTKITTFPALVTLLASLSGAVLADDLVRATDADMYPTDVRYDTRIPTPEAFLGRALGAAPVRHHELVDYIKTVAGLSDRLTVEVIGYSHERRPILFVVASSPDNQARIGEIRRQHIALTEPDIDQNVAADMPVVTWLNYGVHGAESSGMDAALPTLYYLAAAQGPKIDQLLSDSVILVTAVFNPDGHANRIAWLDTFGGNIAIADPNHIEHDYDGRLARTNHYGFDLNRQWMSVTQPEARAWMKKWHAWRPNVSVDYHEMGSEQTYYFAPGIASRTHPLIPDEGMRLVSEVVRPSEDFLDAEARLYFHGDRYDHFFLGKGAAFPLVNGGIGILHEASSARGRELETGNGLRTYRENIRKHFRTGIANAEGAYLQRQALLDYQRNFYDSASDAARAHSVKAYVFDAPKDEARLYHFMDVLNFHRIKTYSLGRDITEGGTTYRAGQAMIVPLDQPQHRLIRSLFDTVTEFQDPKFYDVSTWTLPLAFGLDYAALSNRRLNSALVGPEVALQMPVADVPDEASYAYAFEWSGYYAPRALQRVLDAGLLARVTPRTFVARTSRGPHEFGRGSIVISFDRQVVGRESIHEIMADIAAQDGVFVHAVTSGRSVIGTAGPDLGGQFFRPLVKPDILLIVGRDMDWYNAGEIWHLLDERMNMPVTLRDRDRLDNVDLDRYTHLVFAGGEFDTYAPEYADRIRRWVSNGGTIIGVRQGADWVRANVLDYVEPVLADGTRAEIASESGHDLLAEELPEPERISYAEKEARDAVDVIGGAIFSGDLDISHPLGFGYSRRNIALPKNTIVPLARPANPYATVIAYNTPPLESGYSSDANKDALEGTAALIAERLGDGSVILFADDPNFRGIWYGTNKLFLNALFFSKAFDPPPQE
ncbi:MAG: peptidase [Gammaproteobacteria bacterium]|nr:peptidase [Gammaproteobacteria bacterium]